MVNRNFYPKLALFSLGLSIHFVLSPILLAQAQIVSKLSDGQTLQSLSSPANIHFDFDPPGKGKPDDTVGAGSRDGGQCPQATVAPTPSLTPLMPVHNYGLTTAEHPTFLIYVPQTSAQTAFFSLKDENEEYYYQTMVPLPKASGIVSFKLPDDAPALKVGKRYQWSFVTICGEKLAIGDPRVGGQIQRVELNPAEVNRRLKLSPLESAMLYGKDGIWYDTVAVLAEQRRLQPNDSALAATWENLLKSVGLEAIATKSLVQ
jgi:hypothetical protein